MQLEELRPLDTLLSKIVTSCFQIQPRELAIEVNETAKNTAEPTPPPERATKKIRALGAREPGVGKRL